MKQLRFLSLTFCWVSAAASAIAASGNLRTPFQENGKASAGKPSGDKMDRSWKRYRNPNLGYCVSYPSKWSRGAAFEGDGLLLETSLRHFSKPAGEIDFGPLDSSARDQGNADALIKPDAVIDETLAQDFQEHLEGLQRFARAERSEILDRHTLQLQGAKALYVKHQYYDPLERKNWMQEVLFVRHNGELYRLEMQCLPEQIQRFEVVFAYLVNTLEFDCK